MRTISLSLAIWVLGTSCATTSRDKLLRDMAIGASVGAGAGAYSNSQNKDPNKSESGTILLSALTGAVFAAGVNYFLVEDDQKALAQRADHLESQLEDMKRSVRTSDYRPSGSARLLDQLKLEENFKGPESLQKMVDPSCDQWRFSLAFDGKSATDLYIPVSRDVIIRNVEFIISAPKPGASPETICVKANYPFGYLNLELPGLDSLLYKHGEAAAKRAKETAK